MTELSQKEASSASQVMSIHEIDNVEAGREPPASVEDTVTEAAQGRQVNDMPPGYFRSPLFLGTYFAVAFGLCSGVGGFAVAAPILGKINADIGPNPNINWVAWSYTLCLACTLTLVGRLSDLFGRRYFFIGGNILALVGSIVAATAKSVPQLIGAMVLIGVSASTQISFQFVMGELVPIGKRFLVMGSLFLFTFPLGGLGPIIATSFYTQTSSSWRGGFYLLIGLNVLSTSLFTAFYFPPSFKDLHKNKSRMEILKSFDILGLFLFTSGFLLFLMGLTWGGSAYPWNSAQVLSTVIIGFSLLVAFVLWELYADLKAPYVPLHLFKNLRWVVVVITLSIGANQYYAMALIWPKMITALYPQSDLTQGWMASIVGSFLITGQMSGSTLTSFVRPKYLLIIAATCGSALVAACACANEHNMGTVIGLMAVGFLLIGWQEAVSGTFVTIVLKNQAEIGAAGGLAGSIRSGASTLGSVVYGTILSNRLAQTVPQMVTSAAVQAGLPAASVPSLIQLLQGVGSAKAVQGLTPDILTSSTTAFRAASALAYRDVMLATLGFGGIAMILAWFCPDVNPKTASFVSRILNKEETAEGAVEQTKEDSIGESKDESEEKGL